jgi:hypothetical protein
MTDEEKQIFLVELELDGRLAQYRKAVQSVSLPPDFLRELGFSKDEAAFLSDFLHSKHGVGILNGEHLFEDFEE